MLNIQTEPVHQQLARVCRENITKGVYEPNDRFPSERELAQEFGVSRATANKVIASLLAENLIEHRKGIGTFVTEPQGLHASLRAAQDFNQLAQSHGYKGQTVVLEFAKTKGTQAPREVQQALGLEESEAIFYVERQRLANGEVISVEQHWIRAALVPGLKKSDLTSSFYELLERFALHPARENHIVHARGASRDEAAKLGVKNGAALLVIEGPGFAENDAALWYEVLLFRGDRFHFQNDVRPQRAQSSSTLTMTA
jgi:GntR family transcriptional regulator